MLLGFSETITRSYDIKSEEIQQEMRTGEGIHKSTHKLLELKNLSHL